MVAEQQEFGNGASMYMESQEVYDLFGSLLQQLVIHQPANPKAFLQEMLRKKMPLCLCVIGPPGVNRSMYCKRLESDFGIKHIHVGKLLRDSGGREAQEAIAFGKLVEDAVVVQLVKDQIKRAASRGAGWILDGFPRTKVQAQALCHRSTGVVLDRVLLLHAPEVVVRERYEEKLSGLDMDVAEKEALINTRLQQYQRHIISVAEVFMNVIRQIEAPRVDDDADPAYETIKNCLHVRFGTNAPLRPHRLCIIGPCASGRTTQSRAIAKAYGLVHVDVAQLLKKFFKETGRPLEEIPPEYVSDEELCAIVGRRLNDIDCIRKGWVLDGFPRTNAQAEFLRQAHRWPSRIVHLSADEHTIKDRISSRQVDPVTCTAYYKSPGSVAVRQRLVQAEHDTPDAVSERIRIHNEAYSGVRDAFSQVCDEVDAEGDAESVTQSIQSFVDCLLAHEQDQSAGVDG